jgi:hypothetical protein
MRRGQRHPVVVASDLYTALFKSFLVSVMTIATQRLEIARPEALRIVVVGRNMIRNGCRYHPSLPGTGDAQGMAKELQSPSLLPPCRAMQCTHVTSMLITQRLRSQP